MKFHFTLKFQYLLTGLSMGPFTGPFTPWQPYATTTSFSSRTHDLYGAVGPPM